MRVLVCGGRDYNKIMNLCGKLDELHRRSPITLLIHGTAKGADSLANAWASSVGVPVKLLPADWDGADKPDLVVAFPGGIGTADMVRRAYRARVPVMEVCRTTPLSAPLSEEII